MKDVNNEAQTKVTEKAKGRSIIYDNIDLKVETLDKILIILFIVIAIVFAYAIMS